MATKVKVRERSEMIKRRLANPNAGNAMGIPLKEPQRWQIRIFNSKAATNRIWYAQQKGWIFAEAGDIAGRLNDYGLEDRDGRLVMGERGEEVVMKMEKEDWREIQTARAKQNLTDTFGTKQIKQAIVKQAESQEGGDQGADFLSRSLAHVKIEDDRKSFPEVD